MVRLPTLRRALPLLLLTPLLAGCNLVVMNPSGDIAIQQRNIILISTGLMLLIIVPVMILTVLFAWRYRASNTEATYDPKFDHSASLELVIWSAPLLIIIALGALTWWSTHKLDPFRPLERIAAGRPIPPGTRELRIQVVSLDWKWLFIYPEQGIATVNQLVLPVDRPVRFDLTSTNMMNTFYAPALAGMIYTMPGMNSTLHAVLNKPGSYDGMSANYSGAGFSDMRFRMHGLPTQQFDAWVAQVKGGGGQSLGTPAFRALLRPSENVAPRRFTAVESNLFKRIVERCVEPGTPCMSDIMRRDRAAGGGEPHNMEAGGGMPGRGSAPLASPKPEGALLKDADEKQIAPHFTKPSQPNTAPGVKQPGQIKNRDMSMIQRAPLIAQT